MTANQINAAGQRATQQHYAQQDAKDWAQVSENIKHNRNMEAEEQRYHDLQIEEDRRYHDVLANWYNAQYGIKEGELDVAHTNAETNKMNANTNRFNAWTSGIGAATGAASALLGKAIATRNNNKRGGGGGSSLPPGYSVDGKGVVHNEKSAKKSAVQRVQNWYVTTADEYYATHPWEAPKPSILTEAVKEAGPWRVAGAVAVAAAVAALSGGASGFATVGAFAG